MDDYLGVVVEQRGIDLVVEASAPGGEVLLRVDSPNGRVGPEPLTLIAGAAGEHRIVVRSPSTKAPPGRYLLRPEEPRPASAEDRRRHAAERAQLAAHQAGARRDAESYRESARHYREVLAVWQALGELPRQAEVLHRLGTRLRILGEREGAAEAQHRAVRIFQELGDLHGEATAWTQLGLIAWAGNENELARESYRKALELQERFGDRSLQAETWNNLGLLELRAGRLDEALASYSQALQIFREIFDRRNQAVSLVNVAGVHDLRGDPTRALASYSQALELARALRHSRLEAQILHNQGVLYLRLGRAREATSHLGRALPLFRQQGDQRRQAAALANLGALHFWLRDTERALDEIGEALELETEIGNRRGQAENLQMLAAIYLELEQPARALSFYRKALEIQREVGDRLRETRILRGLGKSLVQIGETGEGLATLSEALELSRALGLSLAEAKALLRRGEAHLMLEDSEKALADFRHAYTLSRSTGARKLEIESLGQVARVEQSNGDFAGALATTQRALELAELQRTVIASNDLRTSYFSHLRSIYERAIELEIQLAEGSEDRRAMPRRTLEIAERARARGLLDQLREVRVEIRRGVDEALSTREQRLLLELDDKVQRQRSLREQGDAAAASVLERDIDRQLRELDDLRGEIRSASPHFSLGTPEELLLSDLQTRDLADGTVLLEYFLGVRRSFLWCVTATSITVHELPPRSEIETLVREVFADLSQADPRRDVGQRRALERLGGILLGPVSAQLAGQRLAIVADGALEYLPFAALPVAGKPLVVEHELVFLPSAAVLGELRRTAAGRQQPAHRLALFADPVFSSEDPRVAGPGPTAQAASAEVSPDTPPDMATREGFERLPWTRREAESIAEALGRRFPAEEPFLATDFTADAHRVTSGTLQDYRILHFATHGLIDSAQPQLSALILSLVDNTGRPRDGFLRSYDIYGLDLNADLVVLSGCRTALGREIRGEGLESLVRAFFHAGASRVMASLWSVQDEATAVLMGRFYRALFEDQLTPAAALRAAQVSLWQDPRFRDPYYWAAFILQGAWLPAGDK
ncbi:MAG: CHAT domain-containing protein [Acidobacteriota bacterium]